MEKDQEIQKKTNIQSGGQVHGKVTQKSLGLSGNEGLSFFSFPGVSNPNRFKQLYRSHMNSVELTNPERGALLQEAVTAFELNIQKMLTLTMDASHQTKVNTGNLPASPMMQFTIGICAGIATVGMGMYASWLALKTLNY